MNYGLTKLNVRKMAYEVAVKSKKKFPNRWNETKLAGNDWLYGFTKRHSDLSLRKPEAYVACQEQQLSISIPLLHFLKNLKMFMIAMWNLLMEVGCLTWMKRPHQLFTNQEML